MLRGRFEKLVVLRFSEESMKRQLCSPNNIYIAIDALKISINLLGGDTLGRRLYSLMVI